MAELPDKVRDVAKEVRQHLSQRGLEFIIGEHAHDEAENDHISDREILHVLRKTGVHVPKHDQYSEDHDAWKYRLEGATFDGRRIAVVVSFTPDPPLPMPKLCVITVFAL